MWLGLFLIKTVTSFLLLGQGLFLLQFLSGRSYLPVWVLSLPANDLGCANSCLD